MTIEDGLVGDTMDADDALLHVLCLFAFFLVGVCGGFRAVAPEVLVRDYRACGRAVVGGSRGGEDTVPVE